VKNEIGGQYVRHACQSPPSLEQLSSHNWGELSLQVGLETTCHIKCAPNPRLCMILRKFFHITFKAVYVKQKFVCEYFLSFPIFVISVHDGKIYILIHIFIFI
jgi:hypothetical protein